MELNHYETKDFFIESNYEEKPKSIISNEKELRFTVDDAVEKAGFGRFQIQLLMLTGLGWAADSVEIYVLSLLGEYISCDWQLHRWQIAFITSVEFIGMMISSPIYGAVADVYGRKRAYAVSIILLFVFGAVSASSPSYLWMVAFRVCTGLALGGIGQGFTLYCEYCPPAIRAKTCFYLCYFWSMGAIAMVLLAWLIMTYLDSWKILLVATSVPAFLVMILLKWFPESARFFLVSNQYNKAKAILQDMASCNKKDLPHGRLMEITDTGRRGNIKDLFGKKYRWTTVLIWYMWFAAAFSMFGISFVSPLIVKREHLTDVVKNSNGSYIDEMTSIVPCVKLTNKFYTDLLWTSSAEIPGLIIFTYLVHYSNRKILISATCFITSVLILLLLLNTHKTVILVFLFCVRGILASEIHLVWIMTTEVFPTTFRALAIGTGLAFNRLGGIIVPYVAQVLIIDKPIAAISLIAGVVFLAGIVVIFIPYEQCKELKEVPNAAT